jgi:hypothetical protein
VHILLGNMQWLHAPEEVLHHHSTRLFSLDVRVKIHLTSGSAITNTESILHLTFDCGTEPTVDREQTSAYSLRITCSSVSEFDNHERE